jgi:hypothetical protein
LIGPVLRRPG